MVNEVEGRTVTGGGRVRIKTEPPLPEEIVISGSKVAVTVPLPFMSKVVRENNALSSLSELDSVLQEANANPGLGTALIATLCERKNQLEGGIVPPPLLGNTLN